MSQNEDLRPFAPPTGLVAAPPELTITKVFFGRSVPVGDYEHIKLSAEAQVTAGEDARVVLQALQDWIAAEVQRISGQQNATDDLLDARIQYESLLRQMDEARSVYRRMKDFLGQFGVDLSRYGDIPF